MSKYILNENIALRSYKKIPCSYLVKNEKLCNGIDMSSFDVFKKCDGKNDLQDNILLDVCEMTDIIKKCEEGKEYSLSEWQKYKNCDNRYVPIMYLQITGKCNYNCIHCFNAKDNEALQSELSYDEIIKLLDEMVDCGMSGLRITGGEPLVHKRILDIIDEIYKRNLCIFEFNTNGSLLTKEVLDKFIKNNHKPQIRISFDGLGFHDWMRGVKGAEEKTISAIKLAKSMGFEVFINMNINKKNIDSIDKSLIMLDELGVDITRIIRTSNAPRWDINKKNYMFTFEEYYDTTLSIIANYAKNKHNMNIIIWQYMSYYPKRNSYSIDIDSCPDNYNPEFPICHSVRNMVSIGSNGNVYPCLEMSGYYENYNIKRDNVKKLGLKKILTDSTYIDIACSTINDKLKKNKECQQCEFLKRCRIGCMALSILTNGSTEKYDFSKCIYFKKGFDKKTDYIMSSININKI